MKKEYEETNKTLKFALNIFQNDKEFWKTVISKLIKENNFVTALELIQEAKSKIVKEEEEEIRLPKVKIFVLQEDYEQARV